MCKRGGIIDSYSVQAGGDSDTLPDIIYLRVFNTSLPLTNPSYPQPNDILKIFDTINTFESGGEIASISSTSFFNLPDYSNPNCTGYDPCSNPGCFCRTALQIDLNIDLINSYIPSPDDLTAGNSAGACIEAQGFYLTDTSDFRQPFNDGYISFNIPMQLLNGAGVIPYLSQIWFDAGTVEYRARFSQKWFKNFIDAGGNPPFDEEHNNFHLLSASKKTGANALSAIEYDYSYILIDKINEECTGCSPQQLTNHIKSTTEHEIGHQFNINSNDTNCPLSHCANDAWCGLMGGFCINPSFNEEYCLMRRAGDPNTIAMRSDDINKFDCNELFELNNQCGVTIDCSMNQSLRTVSDPI